MTPERNTFVSIRPAADFMTGMHLYADGKSPEACINPRQRAGYMATLAADADADTAAWLAEHGGAEQDYEWISRGC